MYITMHEKYLYLKKRLNWRGLMIKFLRFLKWSKYFEEQKFKIDQQTDRRGHSSNTNEHIQWIQLR